MRIDEVLGIRDICGAKAIIKRFKSINREWSEIDRLDAIYYQIIGRPTRKGKAISDVKAIKEVYDLVQSKWKDHCGPTSNQFNPNLPSTSNNQENMLNWVDEQTLTEEVVIRDVNTNKEWKLQSLGKPEQKNDMSSKLSCNYMRSNFVKTGDPFLYSNKPEQDRDEWVVKLVDDINMDLEDKDRRVVSIRRSPSPCETLGSLGVTMNNILTNMMELDVEDIDQISKNKISVDIIIKAPAEQFLIPPLKIKIAEPSHKTKKIKIIKYGGVICSFSMDPDYKKKLKRILVPTKPTCYKNLTGKGSSTNTLSPTRPAHMLSPIPTPSPANKKQRMENSRWSVDLDASSVDAG